MESEMTNFRWSRVFTACILLLTVSAPAHASHWLTWIDELSGPGRFRGYHFTGEVLCIGSLPDRPFVSSLLTEYTEMISILSKYQKDPMKAEASDVIRVSSTAWTDYFARQRALGIAINDANKSANKFPLCRSDRENTITAIVFEYGRFDDKDSGHEDRYTGVTRLSNAQLVAYVPLHRLLGTGVPPTRVTRGVEFGAGAGFYHLTGTTVKNSEEWMPAIPIRIRFIPAEFFYKNAPNAADTGSTRRHLWQAFQLKVGWDYIPTKARWGELLQSTGSGGFENSNSQELIGTWGLQVDLGQVAWALFGKEPKQQPKKEPKQ
jgi:hypothetical protein